MTIRFARATHLCWLALSAAAISMLTACGTTYTAAVMSDLDSKHRKTGVRYYLPQDLIQVTVQVQTRPRAEIVRDGVCKEEPCYTSKWKLEKLSPAVEPLDISVDLMTIADTSQVFLFDTNGVAFGRSDSTITVSEHGLLQGINAKTQGTAGTVVQNLLKFVATAAALPSLGGMSVPLFMPPPQAPGAPQPASADTPVAAVDEPYFAINAIGSSRDPTIADLTFNRALRDVAVLDPAAVRQTNASCRDTQTLPSDEFMARFVSDSKVLRFGFQELPPEVAARMRMNVCKTLDALQLSERRMRSAQEALETANSRDSIYVTTRKLTLLRSEYQADLAMATAATVELRTEAEVVAKQRGYGAAATVETKKFELELAKLELGSNLQGISSATSEAFRKAVLGVLEPDEQLAFQRALLVLSLDDISGLNADGSIKTASKCGVATGKASPCIYHRVARPMRLTGWTPGLAKSKDANGKEVDTHVLKPISSRIVDVVDNRSVLQALDLHSSVWTKRDFAVNFTPQGRLVSVRRDYGSAAEDSSAAIQQGLSGALTQYQSSLGTVKSIRETQNALDLMPYTQQLSLVKAQNELQLLPLSQQLALANAQSSIAVQPISAQLAEATAQLNLIKMQTSLEANQAAYSTSVQAQLAELERTLVNARQQLLSSQTTLGNHPLAAQTAGILAEIGQIKSEIELIKLRKELDELKN